MDLDARMKVRAFVAELLTEHDDHASFADGESLIQAGRLDSLAVVTLVTFLESGFEIDFARIEFDPQRFDSVDEIVGMVEESRAG
jgi:acyl carrier protein